MYKIRLVNNKEYDCGPETTIFKSAEAAGITLEHSCLNARCRNCIAKVLSGSVANVHEEKVLTEQEKEIGYTLTCNARPLSDLLLDIEDLTEYKISKSKTFPAKINSIDYLKDDVLKLELRLPPNANFTFLPGQYVNLVRGSIRRSYSIANADANNGILNFFIKDYKGGQMSNYWFNLAQRNDLLRLEGPLGTFFLRNSEKANLVFLATGTGIAPVKSILEFLELNQELIDGKKVYVIWGGRYKRDLFLDFQNYPNISFHRALSREEDFMEGYKGYVQNCPIMNEIDFSNSQVYACGSSEMINSANEKLKLLGLNQSNFFSDAFVSTN